MRVILLNQQWQKHIDVRLRGLTLAFKVLAVQLESPLPQHLRVEQLVVGEVTQDLLRVQLLLVGAKRGELLEELQDIGASQSVDVWVGEVLQEGLLSV